MSNDRSDERCDVDGDAPGRVVQSQARALVYRFFSLALSDPRSRRWQRLFEPGFLELVTAAAEMLRDQLGATPHPAAAGEEDPAALDLAAAIACLRLPFEELNLQFEEVFGLLASRECPPYETEYCPQTDATFRAHQMADIAGFYRAFGVRPSADMPERPDHAALELELMGWLIAKELHTGHESGSAALEKAEVCRAAQRRFVAEHLAWWLPAFAKALLLRCAAVAPRSGAGPRTPRLMESLAPALAAFVHCERIVLDLPAPDQLLRPVPACESSIGDCGGCSEVSGTP